MADFCKKNCKNSLILPILAVLACCQKKDFCGVRKRLQRPISMDCIKNYLKFCVEPPGGTLLWDKKSNSGPKSQMCQFFSYPYFLEGFCLQVMILGKVVNFGNLKEMVFGKPPGCTSKLCNRLPAWLSLKREIKGLFLKFWRKTCLNLWTWTPGLTEGLSPLSVCQCVCVCLSLNISETAH